MTTVPRQVTVRYAEPDYWEARYQREPALFEWFFGHTALRRIIRTYLSKKKPLLQIGCGTSNLQEGMARSGYTVVNTDISEVVIKQMQQRHAQYTNMTYRVSDCRHMPEFLDCSFGHVVDKGTMDALLCCKQGTENVMRMLLEVYRVLQPGGSFMLITLGDPTRRLPMLCDPRLPWRVSLLLLPKISAANQAYVDGKPINDSTEPVEAQGPFEVIGPDTINIPAGVQYSNFFFIYVCKKQPLQLPQHHGQKAALPNGWVAGSKELFQKLQKELGLPEDLLDKGRRKRVMHVPARQGSMRGLPHPGNSSNASITSGNSSPASLAALQSACSSTTIASARLGDLQSALTALQLEQQLIGASQRGAPTPPAAPAPDLSLRNADVAIPQHDVPVRPQSAPDLVAVKEAEAAAAAAADVAAGTAVVEQALAAVGSTAQPGAVQLAGQQPQQYEHGGQAAAVSIAEAPAGSSPPITPAAGLSVCTAELGSGSATSSGMTAVAGATISLRDLAEAAAASTSPHAIVPQDEQLMLLPPQQGVSSRPAALLVQQLPDSGGGSPAVALAGVPMLVHSASSPASLQPGGLDAEQQGAAVSAAVWGQPQAPAVMQVLNFAAPAAPCAPSARSETGAASAESEGVLEVSPLPPMGKPKVATSSSPASPAGSPSHVSAGSQQLPAWPGLRLQTGQVLPQLQGQQALAVSAATAAGMYPHPVAPRGGRVPRLRRFSTEYGALSGSALQSQLEQLRSIQAQHSESAADGLVLHDVAAGDSNGSGAAAAAAIAAAAWGCMRRPRDRRLSNISILSGLSVMSSTSIDESGEEALYDGHCSTSNTGICSSEPSCQLWGGATHPESVQEVSSSIGNGGTPPQGTQPLSPGSRQSSR